MDEQVYNDNFYKNRNKDTEYAAVKILGIAVCLEAAKHIRRKDVCMII